MIALERPNGHPVYVNPDLIETVERDEEQGLTVVALTTGNVLVVREEPARVADAVVAYRKRTATAPHESATHG